MTDLDYAPPSFTNRDCKKVIFVDFTTAHYQLKFDVGARKATVSSEIRFAANDHGLPVFILNQPILSAHLDGQSVGLACQTSPDEAASFKVVSKSISPGNHVLTIESVITEKGPRGDPIKWIGSDSLECIFNMSDLDGGEYLGAFLPANYNYDHFLMSFSLTVENTDVHHSIFSNGTESFSGVQGTVVFPDFFTSSCPWFHLVPTKSYKQQTAEFSSTDRRTLPILVYTKSTKKPQDRLERFIKKTKKFLEKLEADFGSFPHDSLTIFAEPGHGRRGMEYAGATKTKLASLRHELDHSYFARSVIPVNGNAGWIDEAIAKWGDNGYLSSSKTPPKGVNIGRRSPYIRFTHGDAYSLGLKFLEHLDHVLQKRNRKRGLKVFLAQYAKQKRSQSISVSEFQKLLEGFHGMSLEHLFESYVFSNTERPS